MKTPLLKVLPWFAEVTASALPIPNSRTMYNCVVQYVSRFAFIVHSHYVTASIKVLRTVSDEDSVHFLIP